MAEAEGANGEPPVTPVKSGPSGAAPPSPMSPLSPGGGVTVLKAATAFQRMHLRSMRSPARAKLEVKRMTSTGLDAARRQARAYEYLCHLEEAKRWLEACLKETLPPPGQMEEELANGVVLCKLAAFFAPNHVKASRVFDPDMKTYKERGTVFRHTDNVMQWINAMKKIGFSEVYHPQVTDCYERKNLPRVIYCIHALSHYLFKLGLAPEIENLHGVAEFTEEELELINKKIEKVGAAMPKFSTISVPEPPTPIKKSVGTEKKAPEKAAYSIYWPFYPELWENWIENDLTPEEEEEQRKLLVRIKKKKSEAELEMERREEEEMRLDREYSQEEAEQEMLELLEDHFPHLVGFWTSEAEPELDLAAMEAAIDGDGVTKAAEEEKEEEEEETGEPLPPAEVERLDAQLAKDTKEHMFWDHLFWGRARRYFVHWPFLLDEREMPEEDGDDRSEELGEGYDLVPLADVVDGMLQSLQEDLNEMLRERRMAFIKLLEEEDSSSGQSAARPPESEGLVGNEEVEFLSFEGFLRAKFPGLYLKMTSPEGDEGEEDAQQQQHDGEDAEAADPAGLLAACDEGQAPPRAGEFVLTRTKLTWDDMYWGHTAESNAQIEEAPSQLASVLDSVRVLTPRLRRRTMPNVLRAASPQLGPRNNNSSPSVMRASISVMSGGSNSSLRSVSSMSSATSDRSRPPSGLRSGQSSSASVISDAGSDGGGGGGGRGGGSGGGGGLHPLAAARAAAIAKKKALQGQHGGDDGGDGAGDDADADTMLRPAPLRKGGSSGSRVSFAVTLEHVSEIPQEDGGGDDNGNDDDNNGGGGGEGANDDDDDQGPSGGMRRGSVVARGLIRESEDELEAMFSGRSSVDSDAAFAQDEPGKVLRRGSAVARTIIRESVGELEELFSGGGGSEPAADKTCESGGEGEESNSSSNSSRQPSAESLNVASVKDGEKKAASGSPRTRRKLPEPAGSPRTARAASASRRKLPPVPGKANK